MVTRRGEKKDVLVGLLMVEREWGRRRLFGNTFAYFADPFGRGFLEKEALEGGAGISFGDEVYVVGDIDEGADLIEQFLGGVFQNDLGAIVQGDQIVEAAFVDQ